MKWTKGRIKEKELLDYFMPEQFRLIEITDQDYEAFFAASEQGKKPKIETKGLKALEWSKVWRGRHCDSTPENRCLYEEGVLEGTMPYFTLLGGYDVTIKTKWWQFWKPKYIFKHNPTPRVVVDYMKKSLFKGMDAEIIEDCYQKILKSS